MLKSQIIILVIAIITVIFLFSLPKHLVKSGKIAGKTESPEAGGGAEEEVHAAEIPEKEREKIENLRKSFLTVSDKKKKLKFADSLAALFKAFNQFDSLAKYKGAIAETEPTESNLIFAGEAYFDAASFAIDQNKGKRSGLISRSFFERAAAKDTGNLEIKAKIAKTYAVAPDSTNPMRHVLMLREILARDPSNKEALMNLGKFSIKVGKFDSAAERFEQLVKLDPKNGEAEFYLGYSYMMLKEKDKAKAAFESAKRKSGDPDLHRSADEYLKELNK